MNLGFVRLGEQGVTRLAAAAVLLGLAVLVAAYAAIALHAGTPWLWNRVVHEDGVRTFAQTLLYYEHATRELTTDLPLAVAIGASVYWAFPPSEPVSRRPSWGVGLGVLLVLAAIVGPTLAQGGIELVLLNLGQFHTRAGAPLSFGAHWLYHVIERSSFIAISIGLAGVIRAVCGRTGGQIGFRVAMGVVAAFVLATVVFAHDWGRFVHAFTDPQSLGHEAREAITHSIVTLPIGWGGCWLLQRQHLARTCQGPADLPLKSLTGPLIWLMAGLAGCAYAVLAAAASDAASHGQTTDTVTLVFPHYFEHGFTYVLTPLAAAFVCSLCRTADRGGA